MAKHFGFTDIHSFKDYVGFVKLCAPDEFPIEEWAAQNDQMTLELAFEGLRLGLSMAIEEKGDREEFTCGASLIESAYSAYKEGRVRDGFFALEELQKLLRKVPSQ